jgi:hypothetical protein
MVCRSFSYEEFIAAQDKFQKRQADHLAVLNEEVARAIEDVIQLVQVSHVLKPPVQAWILFAPAWMLLQPNNQHIIQYRNAC